ncbi:Spc19-domain-containing protein [Nemania sp. FL0031]|nr:Spc19-domain-containing protein [Nemania sp. FL0031]
MLAGVSDDRIKYRYMHRWTPGSGRSSPYHKSFPFSTAPPPPTDLVTPTPTIRRQSHPQSNATPNLATGLMSSNTASYGDCVSALRASLSFLESSVTTLESGVSDFPRLMSVLKTARHYELIPQTTLQTAEASLRSELAPAISTLLERADAHIARVDRRVESLKARAELQQGRLDNSSSSTSTSRQQHQQQRSKSGSAALDSSAKLRARVLKQRREALQYSVERLELEVLQKERELRKHLDAT